MANITLVQAINLALIQEMERNDSIVLLGEDIGVNGGVFRVTEGLQKRFGGARVFDTPLAESGIIGLSIGMAMGGLHSVRRIPRTSLRPDLLARGTHAKSNAWCIHGADDDSHSSRRRHSRA